METEGQEMDIAMSFVQSQMDMGDDGSGGVGGDPNDEKIPEVLREQDRFLPIANVARIMKKCIPRTGKVAKDARECVQECISEFISFITSEASDRCHQEKRKTINGEDILWAMNTLGFENYVEPLKIYLQKFRDANKGEKVTDTLDGTYDVDYGGGGGSLTTTFTTDQVGGQSELVCYNPAQQTHHHQQQQQVQQQHQFTL